MLYNLNYLLKKSGLEQRKIAPALKILGKGSDWHSVEKHRLSQKMSDSEASLEVVFKMNDTIDEMMNQAFGSIQSHNLREVLVPNVETYTFFIFLDSTDDEITSKLFRERFNPFTSSFMHSQTLSGRSEFKRLEWVCFLNLATELHMQFSMFNTNDIGALNGRVNGYKNGDFIKLLQKKAEENTLIYLSIILNESAFRNCHNSFEIIGDKKQICDPLSHLFANTRLTATENFFKHFMSLAGVNCKTWSKLLIRANHVVTDRTLRNWRTGKSVMSHENMKNWVGQFVVIEKENPSELFGGTIQYFNDMYETALMIDVIQNESFNGNNEEKWNVMELYRTREKQFKNLSELVSKASYQ
jgi:hypothetical protein